MTLVEGKNRHIKKVCEHIRHPVIKLQRTHFGGLNLTGLPLGACRFLSPKEVKSLKKLVIDEPPANRQKEKTMRKRFPIKKYWFWGLFVFVGLQFDDGFALAQPILKILMKASAGPCKK